jgi:hypothetical protein
MKEDGEGRGEEEIGGKMEEGRRERRNKGNEEKLME